MKKEISRLLVLLSLIISAKGFTQGTGFNTTGAPPDASAMLDVSSTNKGLLIPRVSLTSATDVATIASPVTSLLVYNTNAAMAGGVMGFWYWDGAQWRQLVSSGMGGPGPWSTLGNAGTVDGTNFIGTTDNMPLNFRVNNIKAGRIDPAGAVFLGYQAGNSNTAVNSTGIGAMALFSNTSGGNNTAIGWRALYNNTIGSNNTANGLNALVSNTTGNYNTANGVSTLWANTTGNNNTANGESALWANTIGNSNTASGANALTANSNGSSNTAIGYRALYNNTGGSYNTAIGSANFGGTVGALLLNTTGSYNTALGHGALNNNTTGTNNTALGYGADVTVNNLTNATAIGYNAKVSASNSLMLGGTGANAVNVGIGTTAPAKTLHLFDQNVVPDIRLTRGLGSESWDIGGNSGIFFNIVYMGATHMTISTTGNVGIGTTTPAYALDVTGAVSYTNAAGDDYLGTAGVVTTSSAANYAIRASSGILSTRFQTTSDARIKNIIGTSNTSADLSLLNRIRIVDYTMKDTLAYGTGVNKKVIAQEVERLMPGLVTTSKAAYIPDVYRLSQKIEQQENGFIRIAVETDLKKGETIAVYLGADQLDAEVEEAGKEFIVVKTAQPIDTAIDKLFVYGRKVNDLRSVDYDGLTTLNISATQELSRLNEMQEKKISGLQSALSSMQKENEKLKSQNNALNQKVLLFENEMTSAKQEIEKIKMQLGLKAEAEK